MSVTKQAGPASLRGTQPPPPPSGEMLARLDALRRWPFSPWTLGVIALGFMFTFYDIFNINVSFVQTCVQIKHGCTPLSAFNSLKVPLLLNLAGYVVGAVILSPISDRVGRRNMLLFTMAITGVGSAYTALTHDMTNFVLSRVLTGVGTGADLAVVSTYLSEVAPRGARARYNALIYIASNLGAALGVWLGLVLTTKAGHWPVGLPFAQAGPGFANGWRWMYWVGAILALVAVLMRLELPESPRWLISHGHYDHAWRLLQSAERRAKIDAPADTPAPTPVTPTTSGQDAHPVPYLRIFRDPRYRRRALILLMMWTVAYVTVYSLAGGLTSLLTSFGYPHPEAGVIAAVGILGLFLARLTNPIADRVPRRLWIPISAAIMGLGALVLGIGGQHVTALAFIGAILLFTGNSLWVPITYAWSAEQFPTAARTSGFGLVDGVGHFGGGIGILLIAPVLPQIGALGGLLIIAGFLAVAAVIAQLNPSSQGQSLEQLSP